MNFNRREKKCAKRSQFAGHKTSRGLCPKCDRKAWMYCLVAQKRYKSLCLSRHHWFLSSQTILTCFAITLSLSFRTHFSARFVTGFAHNWKKIKWGYFLHTISTGWKTAPLIQFFLIQSHLLFTTNSPTQSMFCKTYLSCKNSKNKLCLRSL